ncbi:MFS transporter [Candidatus Bathyarchaeota archaeon]|nr:MFS transporter [Candidatus Bathyarchaeota archaeon]
MKAAQVPRSFQQPHAIEPKPGFLGGVMPSRLDRNAKMFLSGAVVNGVSNGVFNAVMQLYLASFGFDGQGLGTIIMMNALTATILMIPCGILADRIGKGKMILAGFVAVSLSMVSFFLAESIEMFALSFALIGVCNAAATVFTPLYSSFFEKDDMDKAFGLYGLINISAMSLGSLAGYVPPLMVNTLGISLNAAYRYTMVAAGSLFVLQYLFYYMSSLGIQERLSRELRFNLKSKRLVLKMCGIGLLANVAGGIMFSLFPYYVNQKFGVASAGLGTLFFVSNLAMALSKGTAASFAKRLGGMKSIAFGIALSAIFLLLMPLSPSFGVLAVFYVLRMGTRFMSDPLITSMFMRSISDDEQSTANSLRMISMNGGGVVSPILGGALMEKVGLDTPAFIGGALTLLVAVLYPLLLRREAEVLMENGGRR